jgi:hypothetical protein
MFLGLDEILRYVRRGDDDVDNISEHDIGSKYQHCFGDIYQCSNKYECHDEHK